MILAVRAFHSTGTLGSASGFTVIPTTSLNMDKMDGSVVSRILASLRCARNRSWGLTWAGQVHSLLLPVVAALLGPSKVECIGGLGCDLLEHCHFYITVKLRFTHLGIT